MKLLLLIFSELLYETVFTYIYMSIFYEVERPLAVEPKQC